MTGNASQDGGVFDEVLDQTNLPREIIEPELAGLLKKAGLNSEKLELENLRTVVANYLQEVFVDLKKTMDKEGVEEKVFEVCGPSAG